MNQDSWLRQQDLGLLGGTGGKDKLDLTLEMIRVFVINDRAGLY